MLDYHGNRVALTEFVATLSAASFPEPEIADVQARHVAAAGAEPGSALLGSFVHHLLVHGSDGAEVELLERAANLWAQGVDICDRLGSIRAALEDALENPGTPGAAERFNTASVDAQLLANRAIGIRGDIDALRADVLGFPHLPSHPRQADLSTDEWDWGNLAAARRTDALVRALFEHASDDQSIAFAVGVAAAYGGNIAGSAYVGQAVGGPRRSHRNRDRIGRNTFGGWLATNHPGAAAPSAMASEITFGSPTAPALPDNLETLLTDALSDTFDLSRAVPLPDLQAAYRRLIRHLELLDGFSMPAAPEPPGQVWMATLYADPQSPPPTLRPQDVDIVGQEEGGVAVQHGPSSTGSTTPDGSDGSKAAKGCGIAIAIIIVVDILQAFVQCIGQWADGNTCTFWENMLLSKVWEQDPPDPRDPSNPNTTESELTVISSSPQVAQLVGMLFDAHSMAWEAMSRAYAFLSVTGLIYPVELLSNPLYAQFTTLPSFQVWPEREEANATDTYHLYPTSPVEQPTESPSPFDTGAPPAVFAATAGDITLALWRQIAAGEFDSQNRDLDADRGFLHPCWAAGGSVHDDPVDVVVLAYTEQ
jgi:hypothetical protein